MHSTRRTFLQQVAGGAAAVLAAPAFGRAAASEKLNIAAVGVGGKGAGDIASVSVGQNVVAICDVDERTLAKAAAKYPGAKTYTDWRKLLEQKDIDAVTVSTPDHMHAPIAVSAMQLGKHVYVQKPLAHTVVEARQMQLLARKYGVVTQMGNQGHSGSGYRTLVKLIGDGAIGKVKEAHAWSNRPIWPQGIERPKATAPVPEYLHWDNWLGVAAFRPFAGPAEEPGDDAASSKNRKSDRGTYHPFNWRGWLDFGVGALGDMGCHIIDPVVWSLELGPPVAVWSEGPAPNGETYPNWETIHYEFAATSRTAGKTVQMTWYDGGKKPARELAQLPPGKELPDNGCLLVGEKGVLLCPHGGNPMLLPEENYREHKIETVAESDHYLQWTHACLGKDRATSHFDYSGPLTETVLLGTIAIRYPQQKLEWNSAELKFNNFQAANAHLHHAYRSGWEVKGLS